MSNNISDYIISGGQAGKDRLNVLSEVLQEYEKALLLQNGLTAGMSFLDVGGGGGNIAMMAAEIVGANGSVTAIDFDDEIIALARQDAASKGINNIFYQVMSAYDLSYQSEYDMVFARFLLSHLQRPADVLEQMQQSVKPGGKIVVEDVHFSGHFCYPPSLAFEEYVHAYTTAAQQKGEDANIGPALFGLFQEAGIENIGFDVIQPCFATGPGKWMAYLTYNNIKDALIAQHISIPDTIDWVLRDLKTFTENEQTIISLPRIFRVWGTRLG